MSKSWMRRDPKRFGVELLCLLVLLYGDPLQAISEAAAGGAELEVTAEAESPPDGEDDSAGGGSSALREGPLLAATPLPPTDLPGFPPLISIHLARPFPGILTYEARPNYLEIVKLSVSLFALFLIACYLNQDFLRIRNESRFSPSRYRAGSFDRRLLGRKGDRLVELMKRAFAELGADYGYLGASEQPIAGAYSLRPGVGSPWSGRIVDFDYRNRVEGVFEHNFLSPRHEETVGARLRALADGGSVDLEEMRTGSGELCGLHLHLARGSAAGVDSIREVLRPILPLPVTEPSRRSFLLLRADQVVATGGFERLRSSPILDSVRQLPGVWMEALQRAKGDRGDRRRRSRPRRNERGADDTAGGAYGVYSIPMSATAASLLRKLAIRPAGGFFAPEVADAVYELARSGEVGTLETLYREVEEHSGDHGIEPGSAAAVLENIERYLGLCPGLRQARGLARIDLASRREIEAETDLGKVAAVASLLASCQPKAVLLALIEEHLGTPYAFELLAALFQEGVVRKRFEAGDLGQKPLSLLVQEMHQRRHPLAWLPAELTEIEGDLEPRSYSRHGSNAPYLWLEDEGFEAGHGVGSTGDVVHFDEVPAEEESGRIASAVESWIAKSNGAVEARIFRADGALSSETVMSDALLSLELACLAGCTAGDLTVFEISPSQAASILFAACAHGGAYPSGRFAAYGRLGMWRSLGGLGGVGGGGSSATLRAVVECQWFYFTAREAWFQQVAWDFGLIALRPDRQTIAILAATDTD